MNMESLVTLLTGPTSRLIMKGAMMAGAGATAVSQERATSIATGILTLVALIVELVQSRIAHKRALMTEPPQK